MACEVSPTGSLLFSLLMTDHKAIIAEAMEEFYSLSHCYSLSLECIKKRIKKIEPHLLAVVESYRQMDDDYRCGSDTYGYETLDSIQGNLHYISDRWGGAFRIAWLLGLVNEDYR